MGGTLLSDITPNEIETVLAHELKHHVNRYISLFIAYKTLSIVLGSGAVRL